ncbi:hypothetical protein G4Y79_05170 [Phototrophicus methaneseepsis]|uniref:Phage portal protein n=1 Tax=Phototrophicus methaneseepsis TaxID=2710758 RepID=A0A7S8EB92_9CHLR|nr:hypothetical protein [Phototrophicus methaneseepsis]QPC83771.1 hypothetical protein G4Y79_05170 [Phototrophicus methaneseepsis]
MSMLGRIWMATKASYVAFIQTFNQDSLLADSHFQWDSYQARQFRYWLNARYYDDTMYLALAQFAESLKEEQNLYDKIRSLRNPVTRLVKLEAAKVFGGSLNYFDMTQGVMPLQFTSTSGTVDQETLTAAIRQVWQWSAMEKFKNTLPLQGGKFGDSFINVVDDRARRKVYMQWLDPRRVYDMTVDHMGNIKEIDIRYIRDEIDPDTGKKLKEYEYQLLIDSDSFRYFKDKEPFDYVNNIKDGPQAAYRNEYGFVPIRHIAHVDSAQKFGQTSFAESINKINNLNDLVSLLHDNIRKVVQSRHALFSDGDPEESKGEIQVTTEHRDQSPYIIMGQGDRIEPIINPIPILETLEAARDQQREIDADMPQLALQKIRQTDQSMSGVAIQNLYGDAIDLTQAVQGNYIAGIVAATQMAISIGALNRYDNMTAYSLDSYQDGATLFAIQPKPIFQDNMTQKDKLDLVVRTLGDKAWKIVLQETGHIDHIQDIEAMMTRQQAEATASAARGIMQALGMGTNNTATHNTGADNGDDDEAEEEAEAAAIA